MLKDSHLLIISPDKELPSIVEKQVQVKLTTAEGFQEIMECLGSEVAAKGVLNFLILDCRYLAENIESVVVALKKSDYGCGVKVIGLFTKLADSAGAGYCDARVDLGVLSKDLESLLLRDTNRIPIAANEPQLAEGAERILVVEDNAVNQKVAKMMLKKLGYGCIIANNGKEACEILKTRSFEMVLMDCQMPVMDGFQATHEIRTTLSLEKHLPIIAFTANVSEGNKQRCLDAGMDGFMTKPVNRKLLESMVEKWMFAGAN
ncbi:response regulator [Puniceicoccaceae bacterium K14]|nr:response regulator [Puniceicoccaceae bacterium K14]